MKKRKRMKVVGDEYGNYKIVEELPRRNGQRCFVMECMICHACREISMSQLSNGNWADMCEHGWDDHFKRPNYLLQLRHRAGLTQKELSELSGVSQTTISLLERDKLLMRMEYARNLAPFLQTSAANLDFEMS